MEELVESQRRVVLPHEEIVADDEREREHGAEQDFGRLGPIGLRLDSLARAVRAGQSRVERREAPLGEKQRLSGDVMEGPEGVGERLAAVSGVVGEYPARRELDVRIDVERNDIAVAAARGDDGGGLNDSGEAVAEDEVVGVGLADGAAEG